MTPTIPIVAVHIGRPAEATEANTLPVVEPTSGEWLWPCVVRDDPIEYIPCGIVTLQVEPFCATGNDFYISCVDVDELAIRGLPPLDR